MYAMYLMGEGNGNPLQYSCLENPTAEEPGRHAVHGVAKSRTQPSDFTYDNIFKNKMEKY